MDKSNFVKFALASLLVVVIVVFAVSFGSQQRQNSSQSDNTKSSLPSVKESTEQNPPKDTSNKSDTTVVQDPAAQPVANQTPSATTPRTGPADNFIPVIILGTLSGFYLVSKRRAKVL
ncbi:hypothetical protein EXS66_02840 [Candidatus Saccharibacteria bacterium]|nr:hypothetical protein [Candidatus Saccharibacteria bacterium]